ncbi:unnamed protein product [Paramecium sonneborni]|uniref:Protein kinase domain-containing protein n=1 Tax=Paramecium sonneborni TaxID=65129 RepID=A0A8S1RC08_9CILI|nr:unnamed protein product [Paramecium sonneborni]
MLQNSEKQKEYFSQLLEEILKVFRSPDLKIINFLYNVIFDQQYYKLTTIDKYSEEELNYQIANMMLYPLNVREFRNTQQMSSLIPFFLVFVIGQRLDINKCIKQEMQNEWDYFLTAVAKKINYEESQCNEYLKQFQLHLEMQSKQSQAIDLDKTMIQISNYYQGDQLLKLLNLMFYQDYFSFAINSLKSQDEYDNFKKQKKQEIIINTFQFIQKNHMEEIQGNLEYTKMQVAISFLNNKYNYEYITEKFDNLQAGILIFRLIELDHKQFQNYFQIQQPNMQEQLFNQIIQIAGNKDSFFPNLILVGKCLSKLRLWEFALEIYKKLIKQINNMSQEKYRIYIQFKIYKIHFLQGQIKYLLKKLINLSEQMYKYKENQLEFYQPKNRNLYNECLFIQLLISAYTKQIDKLKHITIKINTIHMQNNHYNQLKRPFTLLQYEFFRLVKQQVVIFHGKDDKNNLEHILDKIKQVCQQRQEIEQKKSGFFKNIKFIFESPTNRNDQMIQISSYYKAVEELLIINVLVRHREIYILQYLNPNFYPLLRVFLEKQFFDLTLKSQIYLFIHDFDKAFEIAIKTNNYKMIGQIYEYKDKYNLAIDAYTKDFSPSCLFSRAVLYKILQDRGSLEDSGQVRNQQLQNLYKNAMECFSNLKKNQNQYKQISIKYHILLQRQNQLQITNRFELEDEVSIQYSQLNIRLTQSTNSLNQNYLQDLYYDNFNKNSNLYSQIYRSANRISGQINMVQSQQIENSESDTSSFLESSLFQTQSFQKMFENFNFSIRKDIGFFYQNLKQDIISEIDTDLERTLDEFVSKTRFLEYESFQLFENNNLGEKIGQGGFSEVYKFKFQDQIYAAKVIKLEYRGSGETISDNEKSDIKDRLLEVCIVCDLTIQKIKYCLQIEHLGFKFEMLGQIKIYKIILITKLYDNYQEFFKWEDKDKIKFVYKLSRGLNTLQNDRELLHLDLKPDNVLVDSKKKSPIIADFGLSKYSQASYNLNLAPKQMTIKYIDPDLVYKKLQSRQNDVYSYGISLFQYFSGSIPYKDLNSQQIYGKLKQFQEYHQNAIQSIQIEPIKNLILDCTLPIEQRISFIIVIKRLFTLLYEINNPSVKILIELLFDHIEFQRKQRKVQNINTQIKLIKTFIKYTNKFSPINLENKMVQTFKVIFSTQSSQCYSEIIQRMKQFINWMILNDFDYTLKLVDFNIIYNKINEDEMEINFNYWVENSEKISLNDIYQWKPFFYELIEILLKIHQHSICILYLGLEQIYKQDGRIKLSCLSISQNLKIDDNNQFELNNSQIDPKIKKTNKFNLQNDAYAFCILIQQTMQLIQQPFDQAEQERLNTFTNEVLSQSEVITLQEIIDKLLN